MRKPRSNRQMGIESLENRVVFAEDLVMIDVDQLIQWNLITQDSDFAVEHKSMRVPISRDRLTQIGEGEWYTKEVADASLNSHAIAVSTESLPLLSPSLDTNATLYKAISTANHPTESSVATHLAKEAPAGESSTSTVEPDALDSTPLSNLATLTKDPITVARGEGSARSLAPISSSSMDFDRLFLEEVSKSQAAQPSVSTASATRQNEPKNSSGIAQTLEDSFGLSENRRRSDGTRSLRSSDETRFERRQGTAWLEDGRRDLFAESFYTMSLPDANKAPAAQSWALLFGVVHTALPFSVDVEDPDMNRVRRAVLEIVAESERTDLPTVEPPTTDSSNTWKATSVLAAALTAAFYRNKLQKDQLPLLRARIRKQRLSSNRHRRSTGF